MTVGFSLMELATRGNPFGSGEGGGTSADRYSFMGTSMRWPVSSNSSATNTYFATEFRFGTPDYPTTDPRVFCSSFWSPSSPGEVSIAGGTTITIMGWSIETSSGVWVACDGASGGGVATVTNANAGVWLPRVPVTLTANTMHRARIAFQVSGTSLTIPTGLVAPQTGTPAGMERVQGSTSTLYAKLTDNTSLSNTGGLAYEPAAIIAKGGDGRPSILVVGDSIGYGSPSSPSSAWSSRNEFGYVALGLDDIAQSKRLAYSNMSIPGQRPTGTDGWDTASNWALKRAALQMVYDLQGAWPFDEVLSQHIRNSVPSSTDLRIGMAAYYDLLNSSYGKPITQIESLSSTSSTDGYTTTTNQSPTTGFAYGASNLGYAWPFNADVGGPNGLGDPTAYYRANGYIMGSIAPWRYVALDLADDRDIYPVQAFNTTLAADYVSGSSLSLTASPPLGAAINVNRDSGTWSTPVIVTSISGTGPYTVGVSSALGSAAAAGKAVRAVWGDNVHPSVPTHVILSQSIIDWKISRGWV